MVFHDGATYLKADGFYRAQNVLDNLMYRGDIPTMIGAFIDPGVNVADGKSIRWHSPPWPRRECPASDIS
jgi:hypothetical protein